MPDTHEIQHLDGTTTVIEVDDDRNFYVYTTDSSTGDRIASGPSAELGSNYTLDEVMTSYQRDDDPVGGADSGNAEPQDADTDGNNPPETEPSDTGAGVSEPGVAAPDGLESEGDEPGGAGGG
ncbi:hypothetical protein ABH945_007313 [Paraburkholderia sp. GAS333]|uniref:hypothetical protein n=1 Tax=Paraburkholderia sp. GAS333 TaxID=3156279 RepID=UPI003D2578EC